MPEKVPPAPSADEKIDERVALERLNTIERAAALRAEALLVRRYQV